MNPERPFDHPWDYLGDVTAPAQATEFSRLNSTFETWNEGQLYAEGDVVSMNGKAYAAVWNVEGVMPQFEPDRPFDHPWRYLGDLAPNI